METVGAVCKTVKSNSKPTTSFQSLLTRTRREFRQQGFDLRIKSVRSNKMLEEEFYVNAYYDPEDDRNKETAIEVIIHHNFPKDREWDQIHVSELLIQVFDAVVHEFKHQRQSKKRAYHTYWDSTGNIYRYLGDPDEIDAYALSIAIELCRVLGKGRALRYMPKFTSLSRLKVGGNYVSPNLLEYVTHFENVNSKVLRTLAKKIYVRLQKVDEDAIFM